MKANQQLSEYRKTVLALAQSPDDPALMHRVVLALARSGSTAFALSEYKRLELDRIRNHEDIMALGGRLFKDLCLASSGNTARDYALRSAEKYDAAYKDTRGYYSGINAATMALLGGTPANIINMRASDILGALPDTNDLEPETLYYIEATRAEAYLLLDRTQEAEHTLRTAWTHDPLNFTAHASTLKQFRMIEAHRQADYAWLKTFRPPIAIHFAGHMFGTIGDVKTLPSLSPEAIDALGVQISDIIQTEDIGFGFGALAAGADILIAETLLSEGAELHVTLPVPKYIFLAQSVTPFGASWAQRFDACLSAATSVTILSEAQDWPDFELDKQASLSSMGAAIRQAERLSVPSGQLLMWDQKPDGTGTARDAAEWSQTGRPQFILPYDGPRTDSAPVENNAQHTHTLWVSADIDTAPSTAPARFDHFEGAIDAVLSARLSHPDIKQGLSLDIISGDASAEHMSERLSDAALPGSILLSEHAANYAAVYAFDRYATDFIGHLDTGEALFALREKGSSGT